MKYSGYAIITGAGILLTAMFIFANLVKSHAYPFKCSSFTHYDLSKLEGHQFDLFLTQDLRFQDENGGYLVLNGEVITNDMKSYLSRTINLGKGAKIDNDTYRYQIKDIQISPSDTIPSRQFVQLLSEFTSDPSVLQFNITRLQDNLFLVGGPVSYLFICIRY